MMTPQYAFDNQRAAAALQQLASRWEPETMKNTILYRLRSAKTGYILNYALNKAEVEEAFSTFEEALTRIARLEGFDEATVAVLTPVPEEPKLPLGEYMRQWKPSDVASGAIQMPRDCTSNEQRSDDAKSANEEGSFDELVKNTSITSNDDWIDREVKREAMKFAMDYTSRSKELYTPEAIKKLADELYKFLR